MDGVVEQAEGGRGTQPLPPQRNPYIPAFTRTPTPTYLTKFSESAPLLYRPFPVSPRLRFLKFLGSASLCWATSPSLPPLSDGPSGLPPGAYHPYPPFQGVPCYYHVDAMVGP
eukprot:750597-Hanusia_phi.AAC.2